MSEIYRNTGRKAWLLSSASGAVLLAGMAVMTPEQALAACTVNGNGFSNRTITCGTGTQAGLTTGTLANITTNIDAGAAVNSPISASAGGSFTFNMNSQNSAIVGAGTMVTATSGGAQNWTIDGNIQSTTSDAIVSTLGGGTFNMTIGTTGQVTAADDAITITKILGNEAMTLTNHGDVFGGANAGNNGITIANALGSGAVQVNNDGRVGHSNHAIGGTAVSVTTGVADVTVRNYGNGSIYAGEGGVRLVLGTGDGVVRNEDNAAITVTDGIATSIVSAAGDGSVYNTSTKAISGADGGVNILVGGKGTVENTGAGGIYSSAGVAVNIDSGDDAKVVNTGLGGIHGATGGANILTLGNASFDNTGGAVTTTDGTGISAVALLNGDVTILGDAASSVTSTNGSGIFGAALGNGDVSIDAGTVNAGADNAFTIPGLGIGVGGGVVGVALGDGAVDVRLHGNVSVDGGMFGGAAIALGTGHAIVTLDDGVDIDPPVIGMAAISVNGNSTVNIGNNSSVDATLAGAVGLNFGSGGITVDVGDDSTIGDATVPTFGILTLDTSGSVPTQITIGTDSVVNGQTSAILAIAAGSGSTVSIANNGGKIVGGDGSAPVIGVYSDSGAVIDNNNYDDGTNVHRGLIQNASEAPGDLAVLTAGGQMTLNNNGDVIGRVIALTTNGGSNAFTNDEGSTWTTSGASTFITTGSGSNTLTNALGAEVDLSNGMITLGAIGGDNTLANNGSFDVIGAAMFNLGSVSGDNFVQNSGGFTSQGAVMFNLGSVSGNNDFTNTGEMEFTGLNAFDFGTVEGNNNLTNEGYIGVAGITAFNFGSVNGNNTVTNEGGFETYGLTTFNFAAGGTSTFNNNDSFATNGVTSFLGLDHFNNNGMLTMVNGQYDYGLMTMPGTETHVGDWTLIDGNFVASPDSSLAVDARLSVKGDSASDLLSITGDVVGTTKVYVNYDTSAIGGYNPDGITVARVWSGNTSEGDFKLANGPIDRGLYTYDLFLKSEAEGGGMSPMAETEGGASWVLASYADASAYNLSAFTGLAQGVWNTTSDSWIDRAGDLRVSAEGTDPSKRSGIWGRMIGNGANRSTDATITPFQNQSVKIDTGYDQTLWGFQAGIDHEFEGTVADGVLVAGVLAGYVTSNVDFDNGESVKLSGPQVGVYATWVKGGLYVDGLVKGDFLKADYNVGGADDSTDSTTIGVRVESGYRFLTSTRMFIEPNASLAYAHTKFDDINVSGTAVNFDNGDGLEGKLGARFGGSTLKDGVKYDPYVSLGIAGELLSNNSVFLDSGPGLVVEDDAPDVFGEVGAGINIFSSKSGWTGFAKADLRFGDDYFGGTGKIGARWAW
ncbi:hypothetical protein ABIE08_000156 [Kaistia defluvii]|uniref:Autotransporter domain-containing protein n=1 Tax=Kaistia defluvii TaxID=410841 RepID=A0ABV2QTP1_9HYPH